MRNWILIAALIGILGTESSSAQTLQQLSPSIQTQGSPQVDSLRRVLKLSSNLRLDWRTSKNGMDMLSVTDDFNRSYIGSDWAYADGYWQILDGELDVTAAADHEWRYLAIFQPIYNDANRKIHSVSYRWGKKADELGIREAAHALMIDQPNQFGSGYWLWHRTNWFEVWLWIIKNGTWEYTPEEGKEVDRMASQLASNPQAGDVVTAYIRNEPDAVYFDYYVNSVWDGTVKDVTKEFPKSNTWYVGAFIHGQELNNQIDDFTVTWLEGDVVAPAAVNDLRAIDVTTTSINLEWTSTGDNGVAGDATRLELRYSASPITAANFAEATLAPNLPVPAPSGVKQTFKVDNLNRNTNYYFALKLFDEVNNAGPLSNVTQARTLSSGVASALAVTAGCGQTGEVNKNLPTQLIATVTDEDGVVVKNSPVEFVILSGDGTVGGKKSLVVNTNSSGEAKATWKLGASIGTQEVEIRADGLNGSPNSCTATATIAAPSQLRLVSGNNQIVSIGQAAASPLVAQLTDKYNNPHIGESVTFSITAGGGYFLNDQVPGSQAYQTATDSSGQARANIAAGNVYGDTTKVSAEWTSNNKDTTLLTNFFVVAAPPDSVVMFKGNEQTGARNAVLPESLAVQILDAANAPVKNYPVTFSIKSGAGKLALNQTQVNVNTDSSGYARTLWLLGNVAGTQEVEVGARFNNKNLRNTPLVFQATAFIPTAVEEKNATLPQQFALYQNFPNPFSAHGAFGNPETMINFDLPEAGTVSMNIIDMTGRQVRQLLVGAMAAGSHRVVWNGGDDAGHSVKSGIYFLVLRAKLSKTAREVVETRKVVLMK